MLVVIVKSIYNLIRKPNETINIEDGLLDRLAQQFDGRRKTGAVFLRYIPATILAYIIKELHIRHILSPVFSGFIYENAFIISFATTSPLIKLGGTPGPGTVN